MKASAPCIPCILKKSKQLYEELDPTDEDKELHLQQIRERVLQAPDHSSAPSLSKIMLDLLKFHVDLDGYYAKIKKESNEFMLQWIPYLQRKISQAADPLRSALSYALIGNFIDFGAMTHVDEDLLASFIESKEPLSLDHVEYAAFQKDLKKATHLVYLLDNAGEIVFDKVLMETLKTLYPELEITAVVRGAAVYNDATMEDAHFVGIDSVVEVLENGSDEPGTELSRISSEILDRLQNSDLILAKGQGNFESLHGSGLPVYYGFLCKCDLFTQRFQMEKYAGIFIRESSLT